MKKFLINRLKNAIGTLLRPVIETRQDETGFYIKLELYLLGDRIFNRRLYLKRTETGEIESNQRVEL